MKMKFPSYVTRKFYLHLIIPKFPTYATREFKFDLKFRVTSFEENKKIKKKKIS